MLPHDPAEAALKPIVYIDDEPMLCRVFQKILTDRGASAVTFTDPEAALAYLRDHEVAAVICDYRMPMITGLQVLDRVAEGVPFFLVSGDLGITASRGNARVTGVLTKPFRPETLLEMIEPYIAIPD